MHRLTRYHENESYHADCACGWTTPHGRHTAQARDQFVAVHLLLALSGEAKRRQTEKEAP